MAPIEDVAGATTNLQSAVGFRLSRITRIRRQQWSNTLSKLQISPPQASTLRALFDVPKSSVRGLARTLGTDVMSAKRCVDELEERGLVKSMSSVEDRRARLLVLTRAGRQMVRRVLDLVAVQERELSEVFDEAEFEQFRTFLRRLESMLDINDESHDGANRKGQNHDEKRSI